MDEPKPRVRRVWRMTAACPNGEIVEVPDASPAPPQASPAPTKAERSVDAAGAGGDGQAWVLDPAKVPSWHSSSFDLLTGLTVRDVSDTIPSRIFEEVFKSERGAIRRKHF